MLRRLPLPFSSQCDTVTARLGSSRRHQSPLARRWRRWRPLGDWRPPRRRRPGLLEFSATPSTRRLTGSFAHRSKGGSSDPRCTLTVSGTELKAQSTTKQKTLEPRWCEVFSFEYTPGSDTENPPVLDVLVEDIDAVRVSCVRNSHALRDVRATRCLRSCLCAMAWRFHAIDATLSPRHTIHESHAGK